MISTQKSQWMITPRLDSRLLLRGLIAFNIVLAVYNIMTLQSNTRNTKSSPCVVVINTSKDTQNAQKSIPNVFNYLLVFIFNFLCFNSNFFSYYRLNPTQDSLTTSLITMNSLIKIIDY
jgi:hypothetical protein